MSTWSLPVTVNNLIATSVRNPLSSNIQSNDFGLQSSNQKMTLTVGEPTQPDSTILALAPATDFVIRHSVAPFESSFIATYSDVNMTGANTVSAPTVTPSTDNSTKVATTAFVQGLVSGAGGSTVAPVAITTPQTAQNVLCPAGTGFVVKNSSGESLAIRGNTLTAGAVAGNGSVSLSSVGTGITTLNGDRVDINSPNYITINTPAITLSQQVLTQSNANINTVTHTGAYQYFEAENGVANESYVYILPTELEINSKGLVTVASQNDAINIVAPVGGVGIDSGTVVIINATDAISLTSSNNDINLTAQNGSVKCNTYVTCFDPLNVNNTSSLISSGLTTTNNGAQISTNVEAGGFVITSISPSTSQTWTYNNGLTCTQMKGKVYHTDQPTTVGTYYLTFVQSGGVTGYYDPCFDSATLTYNPSTNLLLVNGLQLSTTTNAPTSFTAGYLTVEGNSASSREFSLNITANMTGLTVGNRRTNGVYKINIYNTGATPFTISASLSTTSSQPNRTSYALATITTGSSWVMTVKVQNFGGTLYNCCSLEQFV